jgi:cobalamin biosynthesis protein CbiG
LQSRNVAFATTKFEFGKLADYRLYGLDGVNKVASGEWIEADDDETAIEAAKKMMDGHECELWQGKRLVARIPARSRRD